MTSFKGILKYSIYIFIAGWMFVLGIMVGRGNSPVQFDTRGFQQRLERIAEEFGQANQAENPKEIDLEFYKILDQPASEEKALPKVAVKSKEKKPDPVLPNETPGFKTSTKKKTKQKKHTPQKSDKAAVKAKAPAPKAPQKSQEIYTIQLAAHADAKDAITHMAMLEKKGIKCYRVKGTSEGKTWYRVRTGSFASITEAKKFKEQLAGKKIKAMIMKKEHHENIER